MRVKFVDGLFELQKPIMIIGGGFIAWGLYTLFSTIVGFLAMPLLFKFMPDYLDKIKEAMNNPIVSFFMDHWFVSMSLGLLFPILMIIAGFNFLRKKLWARYLMEGLCWYTILLNLLNVVFLPRMDITKMMPSIPNLPPQAMDSMIISSVIGMVIGILFGLLFVTVFVILICFLHSKKFRELYR